MQHFAGMAALDLGLYQRALEWAQGTLERLIDRGSLLAASLYHVIGDCNYGLRDDKTALDHYQQARSLYEQLSGEGRACERLSRTRSCLQSPDGSASSNMS